MKLSTPLLDSFCCFDAHLAGKKIIYLKEEKTYLPAKAITTR